MLVIVFNDNRLYSLLKTSQNGQGHHLIFLVKDGGGGGGGGGAGGKKPQPDYGV